MGLTVSKLPNSSITPCVVESEVADGEGNKEEEEAELLEDDTTAPPTPLPNGLVDFLDM